MSIANVCQVSRVPYKSLIQRITPGFISCSQRIYTCNQFFRVRTLPIYIHFSSVQPRHIHIFYLASAPTIHLSIPAWSLFVCPSIRPSIQLHGIVGKPWFTYHADINSLWPGDAIWRLRWWSTPVQGNGLLPDASSHFLNQCWLIISTVK